MQAQLEDMTSDDILAPAEVAGRVDAAVRPLLAGEGYDLILVEYLAPSHILRLYIDRLTGRAEDDLAPPPPGAGVGIDDCTRVSRWVGDVLDAEGLSDRIPGSYNLEVSSPGLDRPLARPVDFRRFLGREAKINTHAGAVPSAPGRRRFKGTLRKADEGPEGGVELDVDGSLHAIPYGAIESARLVPEF